MTTYTETDDWARMASRRRKLALVVLAKDEHGNPPACALCGQPGADTMDHVLPRSKYPELTWEPGNLQPAHRTCNSSKGAGGNTRDVGSRSRRW